MYTIGQSFGLGSYELMKDGTRIGIVHKDDNITEVVQLLNTGSCYQSVIDDLSDRVARLQLEVDMYRERDAKGSCVLVRLKVLITTILAVRILAGLFTLLV